MIQSVLDTQIGRLGLCVEGDALVRIGFAPFAEVPLGDTAVLRDGKPVPYGSCCGATGRGTRPLRDRKSAVFCEIIPSTQYRGISFYTLNRLK